MNRGEWMLFMFSLFLVGSVMCFALIVIVSVFLFDYVLASADESESVRQFLVKIGLLDE